MLDERALEKHNLLKYPPKSGMNKLANHKSRAIFVELDWTPSVLLQAEDQLHRIGQRNLVNIYYLIAKDTIEGKEKKQIKYS